MNFPFLYEFIADIALEINTGARALRSILESIFTNYMFDYAENHSGDTITITKDDVKERLNLRHASYLKAV